MEGGRAVVEQRRIAASEVDATLFDLAEQHEQPRELSPLACEGEVEQPQDLVIGEVGQRPARKPFFLARSFDGGHASILHPVFRRL